MYAKFVGHLGDNSNAVLSSKGGSVVAPKTNVVYEADDLIYSKRCFLSMREYTEWNRTKTAAIHTTIIGNYPVQSKDEEPFEVIIATVWRNSSIASTIHAPNCELYVLNNEGKTIDRLWCARFEDQRKMLVSENTRDRSCPSENATHNDNHDDEHPGIEEGMK